MAINNPTTGISTAYDLTVGIPVDMDEAIYLLSPLDAPMITGVNADGHQVVPTLPTRNTTFDWMDESILTPRTTLDAGLVAAATSVTVAASIVFEVGDLIKIEDATVGYTNEVLRVTAIPDATTLTVERGFGGTSDETYTAGFVVGLGTLLPEGSDPGASRTADRVSHNNFTQIFGPTQISMSRTEQGRIKYGVANEFTHQIMNRMREEVQKREHNILYGVKFEDAASGLRSSGGLEYWINSGASPNIDSTNTALSVAAIEAMMQSCYDEGGLPNMLSANPAAFGDLNDLSDTTRVRVEYGDGRRGRQPVLVVNTEYGDVTCVRNRWAFRHTAFMWTREQLTRRVFDPVRLERLAKTGDSDNVQMVCEEGYEFKGREHAGMFTALADA